MAFSNSTKLNQNNVFYTTVMSACQLNIFLKETCKIKCVLLIVYFKPAVFGYTSRSHSALFSRTYFLLIFLWLFLQSCEMLYKFFKSMPQVFSETFPRPDHFEKYIFLIYWMLGKYICVSFYTTMSVHNKFDISIKWNWLFIWGYS